MVLSDRLNANSIAVSKSYLLLDNSVLICWCLSSKALLDLVLIIPVFNIYFVSYLKEFLYLDLLSRADSSEFLLFLIYGNGTETLYRLYSSSLNSELDLLDYPCIYLACCILFDGVKR